MEVVDDRDRRPRHVKPNGRFASSAEGTGRGGVQLRSNNKGEKGIARNKNGEENE